MVGPRKRRHDPDEEEELQSLPSDLSEEESEYQDTELSESQEGEEDESEEEEVGEEDDESGSEAGKEQCKCIFFLTFPKHHHLSSIE